MTTVGDACKLLAEIAPLSLAAEWDNVGLILGNRAAPVSKVMTCLTLTSDVADEAATGAELVASHHPLLFRKTQSLTADSAEGRVVLKLLRAGVAVYSAHTAYDNCAGGINDMLAEVLGLTEVRPLRPRPTAASAALKLVVYAPTADAETLLAALFAAGAGRIGNYSECSFRSAGTGTFLGSAESNPKLGERGAKESVAEDRLEVIVPRGRLSAVVDALRAAHRYEEPAFDVLAPHPVPSHSDGEGRVGRAAPGETLGSLAARAREMLRAPGLQIVGDPARPIGTVALACGAAGEYLSDAIRAKADVFLTGELRFHDLLRATDSSVMLALAGHYPTERPGVERLAAQLAAALPGCTVWASRAEADPLRTLPPD